MNETPSALEVAAFVAGGPEGGTAEAASEEVAAKATARVIGHFPEYLEAGEKLGAKVFNLPSRIWNGMSEEARWAANQKFLDRGINAGADFIMATKRGAIRAGSALEKEVTYLLKNGYTWSGDATRLIPK